MPTQLTDFQKDLIDPNSGNSSELYRAVRPMVEGSGAVDVKAVPDRARLDRLRNEVRRGAISLEYLTGLKSNKGETFYDAHPAQAITSNILSNAGNLGLATAAGIPLKNLYDQWKNFKQTEHAYHARRGDTAQKAENRLYPTSKGDRAILPDSDISRIFGHGSVAVTDAVGPGGAVKTIANEAELERRMRVLDAASGGQETWLDKYRDAMDKFKNGQGSLELERVLGASRNSNAAKSLAQYV